MQSLTEEGQRIAGDAARRHGVSTETVATLLATLAASGGGQAQFNIAELGGMGQWSRGGMTMVGDMFNTGLKARVDALCAELSGLVGGGGLYAPAQSQSQSQGAGGVSLFVASAGGSGAWWPDGLGHAASVGSQNDLRYAVFPETRRLAIDQRGRVTLYDTGDHRIGGVSQQQSGDQSLTFTSQHGLVRVADLPIVTPGAAAAATISAPAAETSAPATMTAKTPTPAATPAAPAAEAPRSDADDIFGKLERLADLRQKGILTEPEFEAKKAELLARL